MCKFFKQEKCNHHFPELNKKAQTMSKLKCFFSWRKASVVLVISAVAVGFLYLTQANSVATKGYQIKELENRLTQLQAENKKLNLEYIGKQSMANLTQEVANMNLVASNDLEVITPLGSAVALR